MPDSLDIALYMHERFRNQLIHLCVSYHLMEDGRSKRVYLEPFLLMIIDFSHFIWAEDIKSKFLCTKESYTVLVT